MPLDAILEGQQFVIPPSRCEQPDPSHSPHDAAQQILVPVSCIPLSQYGSTVIVGDLNINHCILIFAYL